MATRISGFVVLAPNPSNNLGVRKRKKNSKRNQIEYAHL